MAVAHDAAGKGAVPEADPAPVAPGGRNPVMSVGAGAQGVCAAAGQDREQPRAGADHQGSGKSGRVLKLRALHSSFRDAPLGAGPESITPSRGYGFRARDFVAPRNDEDNLRPALTSPPSPGSPRYAEARVRRRGRPASAGS